MQPPDPSIPPVLVLGLGNILLGDDGVGPALVREIQGLYADVSQVECIDGGTQGLALLGYLTERKAIVILDALALGKTPGEVTALQGAEILGCRAPRSTTAHEGNAGELLAAAQLLGDLPERIFLVGVEPECVRTELGLSEKVVKALPEAFTRACEIVERVRLELQDQVVA
jgi:hydrogenase maturation protease